MSIKIAPDTRLKGLYVITDEKLIAQQNFTQSVEFALQGGSRIIQYRDKSGDQSKRLQQAEVLRSLCSEYRAILIINDDIELARAVNADGVHLGKDDAAIQKARQQLGSDAIIGISCYDSLELAIEAEKNSADYVAFGAMFCSPTKPEARNTSPEIISKARQQINIPVCAIGGITEKNIQQLIQQGADMAAVISSLFSASDIKNAASTLAQHFHSTHPQR
ncbi:MAG: thiamine phosphate synthase [Gammaproteobacteria bacterium]|nr:thiamine phosphate synthase [Gammaproteobacteria bacterium]